MKTHSENFKNNIKINGRQIDSKITFGNTVLGKTELNSVTPSFQGAILKSVMKQLEIDSNVEIPEKTILKYEFGVKVNGRYEYINFGNYIVKTAEKQENVKSYKITCYDKMLYSMTDYVNIGVTYPVTIRNYINKICEFLGLSFKNKNDTFANYNKVIQKELYLDDQGNNLGYKFRDVLDELAQATGSTICINNNDELEVRYINNTNDTIDEEFLKDRNVNFGEKYGPINSIVLSRSAKSDNVYLKDEQSISKNGLCELKISDNQIMNFNDRSDYLPDLLNKLNGLEYYLNDYSSTGITYYDLCDKYSVKIADKIYPCIMFNDEININQGLEENVFTEMPQETRTDYTKSDTTDRRINQAYLILNKQEKRLDGALSDIGKTNEKVTTLEATTSGLKTTVSTVEKGLATTNSNLEQTNKDVSALDTKINGVSADFDDFKDNEYMKSISNLQDQIDGAIQFWNGAEIPTLNNYPANQWTTENEKINHQADIYTVIKDVAGELKQGKGYRFDKVNGVWTWVELTDNELSAVQKIAQDALNKANKNEKDVGILKSSVTTLEQTDDQILARVQTNENNIENIEKTTNVVEGNNNLTITEALESNALEYHVKGKSEQNGTPTPEPPVEIRTVKGVTNLFDKDNVNAIYGYILNDSGVSTKDTGGGYTQNYSEVQPNTEHILSGFTKTSGARRIYYYDKNKTFISRTSPFNNVTEYKFTTPNNCYYVNIQLSTANGNDKDFSTWQLEEGSVAHNPVPYGSWLPAKGTGKNLLNTNLMTKFTPDTVTWYSLDGVKGFYNADNIAKSKIYYDLKANTPYSFSVHLATNNSANIHLIDESGSKIIGFTSVGNSTTIVPDSDVRVYPRMRPANANVETQCLVQLEENIQSTPFEPYKENISYIDMNKPNLFDKNNANVINGYFNDSEQVIAKNNTCRLVSFKAKPNTTYTIIKVESKRLSIRLTNSDSVEIGTTFTLTNKYDNDSNNASHHTITTLDDTTYILIWYYFNNTDYTDTEILDSIKIYESADSIPYYELSEINNKRDTLEAVSGKFEEKIGKIILDGSENWSSNYNSSAFKTPNSLIKPRLTNNDKSGFIISNYFINQAYADMYNNTVDYGIEVGDNGNEYIYIRNKDTTDVSSFKTWLKSQYDSGTPVTIYYILAEPQTHQLKATNIPLFDGVNNISLIDDLETNTSIKYLRNTPLSETYISRTESKAEMNILKDSIMLDVEKKYTTKDETRTEVANLYIETDAISSTVAENKSISQQQYNELSGNFDNYALKENVVNIENSVKEIQTNTYTRTEVNEKLTDGSVTMVKTTSGTFDKDGLHIAKTGEEMESLLSNKGFYVDRDDENILTADNTGVNALNLHSRQYLSVGSHCRWEDFEDGVGAYYVE